MKPFTTVKYKFRAEFGFDAEVVKEALIDHIRNWVETPFPRTGCSLPDVVVEMDLAVDFAGEHDEQAVATHLASLKTILACYPDLEVVIDTLALASKYTGLR